MYGLSKNAVINDLEIYMPCHAFNHPWYEVWLHHGWSSSIALNTSSNTSSPVHDLMLSSRAFVVLLFLVLSIISFSKQCMDFLTMWPKKLSFLDIMDCTRLLSVLAFFLRYRNHLFFRLYVRDTRRICLRLFISKPTTRKSYVGCHFNCCIWTKGPLKVTELIVTVSTSTVDCRCVWHCMVSLSFLFILSMINVCVIFVCRSATQDSLIRIFLSVDQLQVGRHFKSFWAQRLLFFQLFKMQQMWNFFKAFVADNVVIICIFLLLVVDVFL